MNSNGTNFHHFLTIQDCCWNQMMENLRKSIETRFVLLIFGLNMNWEKQRTSKFKNGVRARSLLL